MVAPGASDLLEALPLPAVLVDADQRIEYLNAPARAFLGPGIEGRSFVIGLRQPDLAEAVEGTLADGRPRTARFMGRQGARDTTWTAHARRAGAGVLVTFEDRSDAQEAGQMRRDFVANVSHELKTPLTAMIGFIETLRGPARDDAAARERFLATMDREAQRMNRLVRDLLSLSRVEADERLRPRERVDIALVLRSVAAMLADTAAEAGVALSVAGAEAAVDVPGDADQLRQVVTNLAENAIKYGGSKVTVTLTVHDYLRDLRRAGVSVEVADDGPGIDPVHLPRLAERFYRVDTHRSREVGGTGLGLAIVKHIVARHRGRLRIASERGRGSTFGVVLPSEP